MIQNIYYHMIHLSCWLTCLTDLYSSHVSFLLMHMMFSPFFWKIIWREVECYLLFHFLLNMEFENKNYDKYKNKLRWMTFRYNMLLFSFVILFINFIIKIEKEKLTLKFQSWWSGGRLPNQSRFRVPLAI